MFFTLYSRDPVLYFFNILLFNLLVQLHEGVKKSGIMGFCDPCPGEPKQLHVEYTYRGESYEVLLFLFCL
jgi:hypothetical protein